MTLAETAAAWEAQIPPSQKFVLLAITECSGGGGDYSVWNRDDELISRFTSLDLPRIDYAVQQLIRRGALLEHFEDREYFAGECYKLNLWQLPGVQQKETSRTAQQPPPAPRKDVSGYVYVMAGGGYCKIGRAKDPETRLKNIGVKMPFPLRTLVLIHSEDYVSLEADLHERFAPQRREGEWFSLLPEDIEALQREFGAHGEQ